MRNALALATFVLGLPFVAQAVDVFSALSIKQSGTMSAQGLTVMQKAGSTIFARATWGQSFLRITVLTDASTTIIKKYGEESIYADIKEGDILDVDGAVITSSDSLTVQAIKIRDHALLRQKKTLSGTITALQPSSFSFTLPNKDFASTPVLATATARIKKGARTITYDELKVGDKVLSATGVYEYPTNILNADDIAIFQPTALFKSKNLEGVLVSVENTALPAELIVTIEARDYRV